MKLAHFTLFLWVLNTHFATAQTNPAITKWLQNTTVTGRHYVKTGSTAPVTDTYLANVQKVEYSANFAYITCTGIPSYIIGPYLDNNPNQAAANGNIYKMPLTPTQNTGTLTNTGGGTIGVLINGVSVFDYRDGVSYNLSLGANAGGPSGGTGNGVWNRDAVVYERVGFDCAKGHPAGTNYHHHQNPSAFDLDINVISNVYSTYDSDGLYVINASVHSPLLGFAYDGFPIYGAYAYQNVNGTGGIVRMKSSYSLRNITTRTHYYNMNGTGGLVDVTDGPAVNSSFPLGMYREDYQYTPTSAATPDYLDEHNGRFCITPEYPSGIYCYFATVDANHNSAYPYIIGPTYYGTYLNRKVTSITETVTTYAPISPVDLFKFEAKPTENGNLLHWVTASERNSSHFEVERSDDGKHFGHLGDVKSKGQSSQITQYSFLDKMPLPTVNYYRLKQIDTDGSFTYSTIIAVSNIVSAKDATITIYPNPVSDVLIVQSLTDNNRDKKVDLISLDGRIVQSKTLYQGSTRCTFDLQTVYTGTYFVRIIDGQQTKITKVVVQN
jgi:YHYH protein/Secretion system C-terminal sorting domain